MDYTVLVNPRNAHLCLLIEKQEKRTKLLDLQRNEFFYVDGYPSSWHHEQNQASRNFEVGDAVKINMVVLKSSILERSLDFWSGIDRIKNNILTINEIKGSLIMVDDFPYSLHCMYLDKIEE